MDRKVWDAVAKARSAAFADSYLFGAAVRSGKLRPRTQTAWKALAALNDFVGLTGLVLVKPPAFHESGQVSVTQAPPARYRA